MWQIPITHARPVVKLVLMKLFALSLCLKLKECKSKNPLREVIIMKKKDDKRRGMSKNSNSNDSWWYNKVTIIMEYKAIYLNHLSLSLSFSLNHTHKCLKGWKEAFLPEQDLCHQPLRQTFNLFVSHSVSLTHPVDEPNFPGLITFHNPFRLIRCQLKIRTMWICKQIHFNRLVFVLLIVLGRLIFSSHFHLYFGMCWAV